MSELAQAHLNRLVGARLVALGRAADLQHFTFAEPGGREVHIHTEVAWRLTQPSGILAGRADYWRPATPDVTEEALDAGEIGATLRDVRNEALRAWIAAEAPRVTSAAVDRFGGLGVDFTGGRRLDIFPDASPADHDEWEFWRLFVRGEPHLVVGSAGTRLSAVRPG